MNKERLVFEVADGVTVLGEGELISLAFTPNDCRKLVSRAARLMALSPDYSIRRTFDFELTKKGWYSM